MMNLENIVALSLLNGFPPHRERQAMAEYLQCLILQSVARHSVPGKMSFIGGTSLRFFYNLPRFSEDLDFDNFGLSFNEFKKILDKVILDMKLKGFEIEFRFVEKRAYNCYIKFPRILQKNKLTPLENEKLLIRIDSMEKEKFAEPTIVTLNKFELFRNINVNSSSIILSQKLIAIRDRKRSKGRDFYDVSFLYGFTSPNFDFIRDTMGMDRGTFFGDIIKRCETLDFKALAKDVEPFLITPDQVARVETFLEFIKTKIVKGVPI